MTTSNSRFINWSIFTKEVPLNDFDAYEAFLFSNVEDRIDPGRYEKFIKRSEKNHYVQGFYMPFANPTCAKEFALNHYIYWNCLGYLQMKRKMQVIYDYNTEDKIYFGVACCWACKYSDLIKSYIKTEKQFTCNYCPLWLEAKEPKGESCLTVGSLYARWFHDNEDVEFEIARMPWKDYDYLIPKDKYMYKVIFDTKKGGDKKWIIHLEATTVQEATQKAKELWYDDPTLSPMHMFHVETKRLRDDEEFLYHYFKPVK